MPTLLRFLLLLLLAGASTAVPARQQAPAAASSAPAPAPDKVLDQLRGQLDDIQKAVDNKPDTRQMADLRSQALAVQDQAMQTASGLEPQEQALQAQLTVIGPAPAKGAPAEAPEVRRQRDQLDRQKADLDALVKRAQLMGQEAAQVATLLSDQRRNAFQARLASRTSTPFSRAFWVDPLHSLPTDLRRLGDLGDDLHDALATAWQPPNRTPLLACLVAAALLLGVGRWLLERILLYLTQNRVPAGHLRRSALTLAIALLTALSTGLAAQLVYLSVNWNGLLSDDLTHLAQRIVNLIVVSAYVAGLGRALLSVNRPSWRMPSLTDQEALALRHYPWLIAVTMAVLGSFEIINYSIGASLPATVATRGITALIASALVAAALLRLSRVRRQLIVAGTPPPPRPLWVGFGVTILTLAAFVALGCVVIGYIALAFFLALNTLWIGVVVCSLYLAMHVVNDALELMLSPRGQRGQRLQQALDTTPERLEQTRTILTGITRASAVLLAIASIVSRLGASPEDLSSSIGGMISNLHFGELPLSLGDVVKAVLVFAVGLLVIRLLKRWLSEELLPHTSLTEGMRSSVVTLLGYVGGILVVVLALATLKVGLQNIAWIASALSVGIGFGLQAIVSNFISGLILLAERPVKVGDWISVNAVEGDIRRINVRATELQLWDRSTMIVPNSQLITQNVRNVTWSNAQGRISFKLPMPLDTDAERVRDLMLEVLHTHESTLDDPEPFIRMSSIDAHCMVLAAYAYTRSPRDASRVQSELMFAVLARLREENIPLIRAQDMVVRTVRPPREAD